MKNLLAICFYLLVFTAHASEDYDQDFPPAISVAFDAQGRLWRVSVKDGFVLIDHSADLGKTFATAIKLNTEPQNIVSDGDVHPKLAIGPEGNIYLAWTQALSKPYTGYIWFSRSTDGGKSFSAPTLVYQDSAEIICRFEALSVAPTGRIYVAWLDKRALAKRELEAAKSAQKSYQGAAIYYAVSEDAGTTFKAEQKLVDSGCECSYIALVTEPDGHAVAMWRHLFEGGVSDYAIARFDGIADPELSAKPEIHRASFGGKTDACPQHEPALARGVQGGQQWGWHMAWFDGGEKAGLFYARMDGEAWVSSPAKHFGSVWQQAGHPALLSQDEQVWLAWKELTGKTSIIKLAVSKDGGRSWDEPLLFAQTAGRSDYPLLLEHAGQVYLGWNTQEDGFRLINIEVAK